MIIMIAFPFSWSDLKFSRVGIAEGRAPRLGLKFLWANERTEKEAKADGAHRYRAKPVCACIN